ncbi:MAG: sensor histidine kinase [Collinsella sp.]
MLAIVAEPGVLTHEERTLADAIVSEGELALDRARAMEAREEAAVLAKNEQLRANLLRSISHDLRTPLTSISGNADVLLDQGSTGTAVLDAQTRRGLLLSIRSDALWLNATVENLLLSPSSRVAVCACRPRSSSWTISSRRRCAT